MSTITTTPETIADLLERLDGISPNRVRLKPPPGTAVEDDVERYKYQDGRKHLLELVDGTLIEKAYHQYESQLTAWLSYYFGVYLLNHPIGVLLGSAAGHRLGDGLVRMPDAAFISHQRFSKMKGRPAVIPFAPDFAVEVIIPGNTDAEMQRKLQDYFAAGVRMIWYVYAMTQKIQVYRTVHQVRELTIDDTLDGEEVLPGFSLSIREWFSHTV